jgi:hypothetical protein
MRNPSRRNAVLLLLYLLLAGRSISAQVRIPGPGGVTASAPTFTDVQGKWGTHVTSGTAVTVTLNSAPTQGNLIVCYVSFETKSITVSSVSDSNGNVYTISPNSPSNSASGISNTNIAYLLNAPSNASATINGTAASTITFYGNIGCEEFHRSSGVWSVDNWNSGAPDIDGFSQVGAAAVNTPSVTPTNPGELLVCIQTMSKNTQAPYTPWTLSSMGIEFQSLAMEYILSGPSGATACNFGASANTSWNSQAMAFK